MEEKEILDILRESMYGYDYMFGKYRNTEYIEAVLLDIKYKLKKDETTNKK